MMPDPILAAKIQKRNDRLTFLLKQYEAAWGQLNRTQSEMDKVTIQQQISDLEREMEQVKQELENLEAKERHQTGPKANIAQQRHWEEHLPEINFNRPLKQVQAILERFEDEAGAALFLLPDSTTMRADWFVARLRRWLEEQARHPGKVRYYRIELSEHNQLTPWQLLKRLGSLFNCAPPAIESQPPLQHHINQYAATIIDTLYQAMEADSTLLLDLTVIPPLCDQEPFLTWFLQTFWTPLARKLPEVVRDRPMLKCIMVITTEDSLPLVPSSSTLYCPAGQFDCEKITHLPLDYWTEQEIQQWLIRFAGLHHHLAAVEIKKVAQAIYTRSRNGEPLRVEVHLRHELKQFFTITA